MADVVYPLKMPADLYGQVRAAAKAADQSTAQWLRQAVRDKLRAKPARSVKYCTCSPEQAAAGPCGKPVSP